MNTCNSTARNSAAHRKISPMSNRGKKRHSRGHTNNNNQRPRWHSNQANKRQKLEPMDLDPLFPKLNQSDPVQARRIQQRRKCVSMGKNTAGYFEYTNKVPKHKRKPRSMDTPQTPDHTLDIPGKRWQGMVKAWRKALHQYDPPDLATNATAESCVDESNEIQPKNADNDKTHNVQARQIEEAIAKGLLVDVSTPAKKTSDDMEDGSPLSVLSEDISPGRRHNIMEFDDVGLEDGDVDLDDGDDSDDDLL